MACIVLTGAPLRKRLDWSELQLTKNTWLISFEWILANEDLDGKDIESTDLDSHPVEWRSIPLQQQHLPTGLSRLHHSWTEDQTSFLGASDEPSASQAGGNSDLEGSKHSQTSSTLSRLTNEALDVFYEDSYALHRDIASSQLYSSDSNASRGSDQSDQYQESLQSTQDHPIFVLPSITNITRLQDIPGAMYLRSVEPQTLTADVIVGIISLSQSKTIHMKRGGQVDLVEMLVGDETKSGFIVNVWLPNSAMSPMRESLQDLRACDVVLIKNVALGSFRGRVFGQTLRKDMTKLFLLHRLGKGSKGRRGVFSDNSLNVSGEVSLLQSRTKVVRNWVRETIGGAAPDMSSNVESQALPPDTQ